MSDRNGVALTGGRLVLAADEGADAYSFIHRGSGGGIEAWYVAGVASGYYLYGAAINTDYLYAAAFTAPGGGTLDRVGVYVTTSQANSTARLGIYEATSRTNLYPNSLILDAGEITLSSTGLRSVTISQKLEGGKVYYFALNGGANVVSVSMQLAYADGEDLFGVADLTSTDLAAGTVSVGLKVARTYGALPSTFPASAARLTGSYTVPAFHHRWAA